jgi:dienelactone hydrolase
MRHFAAFLVCALVLSAQSSEPYVPTSVELQLVEQRAEDLGREIAKLRSRQIDDALIAEVEIFHKALEWQLRFPEEIYRRHYLHDALAAAAVGIERAKELEAGRHAWTSADGWVQRAYRSQVDGSVQPYAVSVPKSYDSGTPMRLDIVLHGRNSRLSEVSFLATHLPARLVPLDQDRIILEVFGRTNNAYRWAGETDVFEALAAVVENYNVDPERIVLRGFSMGGAGAWHLGLHHPDKWAAVEAGAGFTDTLVYAEKSLDRGTVTAYQRPALHIYDAVDYAVNAYNLPFLGYGGEDDPQLQASLNILDELALDGAQFSQEGLNWTTNSLNAEFLVGPKTGHRFHPESKLRSERFIDDALGGEVGDPASTRCVTYTTRYPHCFGVEIDGLAKHYVRAELRTLREDKRVAISTQNVSRLRVDKIPNGARVEVDGQVVAADAASLLRLKRVDGKWAGATTVEGWRGNHPVKRPGLQGPIDDAFSSSFMAVTPSGESSNHAVAKPISERLAVFQKNFAKWLRADVPTVADGDLTETEIRENHLILFGDPESNRVLAKIAGRLPIVWNTKEIRVGERIFDAANHVLVMVAPNPLNPDRYVVLNSGHTFGETEFRGTNALLFPRLGDYAVLTLAGRVATAGYFDENWKIVEDPMP